MGVCMGRRVGVCRVGGWVWVSAWVGGWGSAG